MGVMGQSRWRKGSFGGGDGRRSCWGGQWVWEVIGWVLLQQRELMKG